MEGIQLDNFAHFGDGNSALIMRRRRYRGEDGVNYWEFFFRPTRRIREMYNIEDEINPDGTIRREYTEVDISVVDENANHLRIWIYSDFDGNPTPLSRRDDDKDMQILQLQKKSATLELEISELQTLLKKRATPELYVNDAVDIIKKARSAAKKMKTGGEGESGDEEDYDE